VSNVGDINISNSVHTYPHLSEARLSGGDVTIYNQYGLAQPSNLIVMDYSVNNGCLPNNHMGFGLIFIGKPGRLSQIGETTTPEWLKNKMGMCSAESQGSTRTYDQSPNTVVTRQGGFIPRLSRWKYRK